MYILYVLATVLYHCQLALMNYSVVSVFEQWNSFF